MQGYGNVLSVLKSASTGFGGYLGAMAVLKAGKINPMLIRSAAAFATFTGGYRFLRLVLKKLCHQKTNGVFALPPEVIASVERFSPAIAAAGSAFVGNTIDPSYSSSFFVVWLFLRALRTIEWMPSHPLLPTLTMIASVEVIVPGGFNSPEEQHGSYRKFLESFSVGVDVSKMRSPGQGNSIGDVCHPFATDFQFMYKHAIPSLLVKSCQVYYPLHLMSSAINYIMSGRKEFKVANLAENILRSTAFLTGWVGTMWFAVMAHSRYNLRTQGEGELKRRHLMMWAWLGGFWLLFERPSRQVELATYCGAHAINSIYNRYRLSGHIKPSKFFGTFLLMTSCALLLHSWSKQKQSFVNKLLFGEEN